MRVTIQTIRNDTEQDKTRGDSNRRNDREDVTGHTHRLRHSSEGRCGDRITDFRRVATLIHASGRVPLRLRTHARPGLGPPSLPLLRSLRGSTADGPYGELK